MAYVLDLGMASNLVQQFLEATTNGVHVVAFGPHSDAGTLRAARAAGATTLTNSQLESELGPTVAALLRKE